MKKFLAAALLALTAAACAPTPGMPSLPTTTPRITEDDPRWNCMTMGNHTCGPNWVPVPTPLADALAEGSKDDATTFDWEGRCLTNNLDTAVCDDGWVERW